MTSFRPILLLKMPSIFSINKFEVAICRLTLRYLRPAISKLFYDTARRVGNLSSIHNKILRTTGEHGPAVVAHTAGFHGPCTRVHFLSKATTTRMWDNAQRDGRPAECRWRPLFNAAKVGWRPLLECRAVTLPRRQTRWNLQGCPKLTKGSQPLVGRSSPYCGNMWRTYRCLTCFFPIVDTCLSCEDIARQSYAMVPRWWFLATFLRPAFPASRMQQVSNLHLKFALRPHHVWKYGRHPI